MLPKLRIAHMGSLLKIIFMKISRNKSLESIVLISSLTKASTENKIFICLLKVYANLSQGSTQRWICMGFLGSKPKCTALFGIYLVNGTFQGLLSQTAF